LTVERFRGLRCSLRKNDRPGAFIRARSTSQALIARISPPPERVRSGEAALEAGDVKDADLDVHLLQHQGVGLGDPEPMTKHQQD
jgi:hypothetical protein